MEGTIHIKNKLEQEYWIDGVLVDKITTSAYDFRMNGREAYVHYKSGEVETIQCVVVIEVLGTYRMEPKPIPTSEEEKPKPSISNRDDVLKVLDDCDGDLMKAGEVFGLSERTFCRRMKQLGIKL